MPRNARFLGITELRLVETGGVRLWLDRERTIRGLMRRGARLGNLAVLLRETHSRVMFAGMASSAFFQAPTTSVSPLTMASKPGTS
jgi:hypothetical protein